ncbi:MAG: prepilin-type N-terminal cleavage/methylation domain-containing protein [Desulfobacteraceae bacterium]|nr:prepilin-type N-terminal cleavage/methylation domain-containing protein [Desulfobacteraceae bacterium]
MPTVLKSKKGTSLVEVLVAVLIFAIVIIGGSLLFASGRSWIDLREHHRAAIQLAAQKLEKLKAGSYYDIKEGETKEDLSFGDFSYGRGTVIEDTGLYKEVTVTVFWEQMGKEHNVSLFTFIAPK